MNTQSYPGQGLTIPQLLFALNEELKRAIHSPSFTFEEVSQIDQDTSVALANIRECRNSFVPINRVPLDILSLILTHLPSQEDRFRASFVCRHWRRTFLRCAELWSELFLSKGEVYVKSLLERAKESPLNITIDGVVPVSTTMLLSSHGKRIRRLDFIHNGWTGIERFSEVTPGPFPLLHVLTINTTAGGNPHVSSDKIPMPLLLSSAENLKMLSIYSAPEWSPFSSNLVFPNLVSFDLFVGSREGSRVRVSQLLDFLESSPMLREVLLTIFANTSFEGVPQGRVVVLPNAKELKVIVTDGEPGYKIAAHISCPSAKNTSILHKWLPDEDLPEEIFPTSVCWNAIVHQHSRSPVEEVTLEIKIGDVSTFKLTFRSSDDAAIELWFASEEDEDEDELDETYNRALTQAIRTIRDHPQLANLKRLNICDEFFSMEPSHVADQIGRLFKSVGPLDKFTVSDSDLRPYLRSFLNLPEHYIERIEEPVVFPQIKELVISDPMDLSDGQCAAIVGLAKSHHERGIPFESMIIRGEGMPAGMKERLEEWVGSAECCEMDDN